VQTVSITDSTHPRHTSKIRTRPLRWEAKSAMTTGEALAAATILLNRTLGSTETLQLGSVSNPALEAGDVLTITDITDTGRVNVTHIVDGFSLDLVTGDMTVATRSGLRRARYEPGWVPVKVTATSPLTVTLANGASVKAIGIVGLTYATTGTYFAIVQEGSIPVVFPTGTVTGTDSVIDGNA
jgi:hypothetical protein